MSGSSAATRQIKRILLVESTQATTGWRVEFVSRTWLWHGYGKNREEALEDARLLWNANVRQSKQGTALDKHEWAQIKGVSG